MIYSSKKFDIERPEPVSPIPEIPVPKPTPKVKKSKWALLPFLSGVVILSLLVQGLLYLSSAKNSQKAILGAATSAYGDLNDASSNLAGQNFSGAQLKFSDALSNLQSAQDKLDQFKALELVASQAKSADHILSGASYLAAAGQNLTSALSIISELKVSSGGVETVNLADKLRQNQNLLAISIDNLKKAATEFNAATDVPASYQDTLQKAKDQVSALTGTLENLSNLENIYIGFFGSGPRVYLMLFENPDEVRATGGFIGTYGVIKINDGKIQDMKIDSIYDLDGHIYDQVAAPGPFQPYIKKWGIRDANWFVDFPTSAQKLLKFYESGAETADGVLAFTPQVFEDLLSITGPISLPAYKVTLDSNNFQEMVQYKTSIDYTNQLNPKQMLSDFAPVLLDRLGNLKQQDWISLMQVMQDNLLAKNVLLYSKNPTLEQNIENLKVAGNILPTEADYLDVVNTNMGGTKSDLSVAQTAHLSSKILTDGSIIDTLTIDRVNNSTTNNIDFLRVLVPLGSTLLSAKGLDTHDFNPSTAEGFATDPDLSAWDQGQKIGDAFVRTESGKTEFTGWVALAEGEGRHLVFTYIIPYRADPGVVEQSTTYSLLFQKQPGSKIDFSAELSTPNLTPYWLSQDAKVVDGKVNFDYTTKSDQYWAVVLTK